MQSTQPTKKNNTDWFNIRAKSPDKLQIILTTIESLISGHPWQAEKKIGLCRQV